MMCWWYWAHALRAASTSLLLLLPPLLLLPLLLLVPLAAEGTAPPRSRAVPSSRQYSSLGCLRGSSLPACHTEEEQRVSHSEELRSEGMCD